MSVQYDYETGRPNEVLTTITRRVGAYTRRNLVERFKIGISNNPDRRWREAYKYAYDEMLVLYCSASISNVSILEDLLVEQNFDLCDNLIGGGGGNIGEPPYYLYLVRKNYGFA